MKTRRIVLYYGITPTAIISPSAKELERKEAWLKAVQASIPAEWTPKKVKVEYTIFNPEVEDQQKFFNGTVVTYYAIQNMGMANPDTTSLKQYREEILDEMLGYDYQTANKVLRKRKSTTEFDTVEAWNTFLNEVKETIFDNAGYEFPDSKQFWEWAKEHGYDEAKEIAKRTLWAKMQKKGV